jgi:hypothetical protein
MSHKSAPSTAVSQHSVLLDRHGSVFWSALHRSPARRAWPRCSFAPGAIREAVPQRSQERLPRCRGDCGSRAAANHALRGDQDAGADGPASSASRALAPRQPADGGDQSNPRLPDGARHHRAARCGAVAQGAAQHPELKYGRAVAKNGQSHRPAGPGLASFGRAHCSGVG